MIVSSFLFGMDSGENDMAYDMLDLLAYKCNSLTAQLRETSYADEQEKLVHDFLHKIDKEFNTIDEIREGLFNLNSIDQSAHLSKY